MQYVFFKSLKITNFLSVGKRPVAVDFKPGLNIITGRNMDKADRANGVGKSTIADAIHFALYGSTIRELKKENIVNNLYPEDVCEVELEFTVDVNHVKTEYKIIRTLNPTKCFLYVNGEDKTRSGVPQTTEFIVDIINTSSEVFQNSVIMTINATIPFMAQKKIEKRKFIEGILDLEVFSNMLSIARFDFNETKRLLDIELTKVDETEKTLQDNIKQRDSYEETKKKRKDILLTRQRNNEQEIALINEKVGKLESVDTAAEKKILDNLTALKTAETACDKKIASVNKVITEAETHIKLNNDRIKKLKKVDSKCPHCGKDLAEAANTQYEKDKAECQAEIQKYTEIVNKEKPRLVEAQEQLNKVEVHITNAQKKINDFNIRKKEVENINNRLNQLKEWQSQLVIDIEALNVDDNVYAANIKKVEDRIAEIKIKITELQAKIDIIESAKFITSEEGVKSFIVKKILEVLNLRLAFYLKKLESNSTVKFNEFFEETITNERGVECSYFNFSGAERKAIDLAMIFTFQDIRRAQANVWLNLSVFDELLDSSLDEKGIELVLDIIRDRVEKYQEAVYVISHRKESMKYCTSGEIIYLEKKNGITVRSTTFNNE
jgi:DNA repair exonuclease SbcCD ATPase subunit